MCGCKSGVGVPTPGTDRPNREAPALNHQKGFGHNLTDFNHGAREIMAGTSITEGIRRAREWDRQSPQMLISV
jgi:hypothetical protein